MRHFLLTLFVTAGLFVTGGLRAPAAAHTKADLDAQLKLLMAWWPGHYDNNEQIVRQSGGGLAATKSAPFFRVHSIVRRVNMPELGPAVVYVEEYKNNDPADIAHVHLYALHVDEAEGAIVMTAYAPRAPKALLGADADLGKIEALKAKDLRTYPSECAVYIHWEGAQFRGAMKEKTCNANAGQEWFQYQITIGAQHYWTRDRRIAYADGAVAWERAPDSRYGWFEGTKARWFSCGVQENPDGDMTKTKPYKNVVLHDQGGEADIPWPDGRTLTFVIHDRAFTSPPEREFPLFRIHDKSNMAVPIAYAYAVDEAERFGLNLGWFYIRCQVKK